MCFSKSDGGSENVNKTVSGYIDSNGGALEHMIAQKDVAFSNSMIEAVNKIIKHQFLYPKEITTGQQLKKVLHQVVDTYNTIRPQMSLGGNTPFETFKGTPIEIKQYTHGFTSQKQLRIKQNRKNACQRCH